MKKISVIIPIYNGEKFLKKCISSLINQKLSEIEIILINDGSKDNTDNICKELEREYSNIRYYKISNSGCSFARNYGLKKAKGEYITFVDIDDWVNEEMYVEMYKKAKSENLDILICGYNSVSENNKLISVILPEEKKNKEDYISSTLEWFNSPWNKIYRSSLIKENNLYFLEKCHMGEDMLFNFKAFNMAKKINVLEKAYYYYIIHENSVTKNPNKRKDIYLVIKEVKKLRLNERKLDECIRYHGIIYPFCILEKLKENKQDWEKYYKEFCFELETLKKYFSLKTRCVFIYRKIRLNFVFLKKYLIKR